MKCLMMMRCYERCRLPDFPTGGLIMGTTGVARAYATGSGSVLVRARTSIEKLRSGRTAIVATELPYLVSKGGSPREDGRGREQQEAARYSRFTR